MSATSQISGGEHFDSGSFVSPMIGGGYGNRSAKAGGREKLEADVTLANNPKHNIFTHTEAAADHAGAGALKVAEDDISAGLYGLKRGLQYGTVATGALLSGSIYGNDRANATDQNSYAWNDTNLDATTQEQAVGLPAYAINAMQVGNDLKRQINLNLEFALHESTMEKVDKQQMDVGNFYDFGIQDVANDQSVPSQRFGDQQRQSSIAMSA